MKDTTGTRTRHWLPMASAVAAVLGALALALVWACSAASLSFTYPVLGSDPVSAAGAASIP
jgi:hypothetical protein